MKLQVEACSKAFEDKVVLDELDLAVAEHEVVCLVGASGSGKSTLLKVINLLVPVDSGRILLDGRDITAPDVNVNEVRSRMAIVFQSFNLFPHMNVIDNITLAPRKVHGVGRREATAMADELLARFGLLDKRTEYPDRLSGGQQQRVAIVRALALEPELLLLDEVTSALDPVLVGEVLALLRELKESGITMVIATHEMGFARESADRVAFLHAGKVWEEGPPSELFTAPGRPETREFLRRITEAGRL
ncbi:MAG TPA: amino acid ABC transporter ATP-binding protein [Acidimicrobiia bacterium]|jgi:polar amino acid transport system ATP-binding protein|nr:amino acid ABC transporter ATP-binding protein [Acidimicrobiia bacterium]